jgi:hypothetical protein
VVVVVDVVGRDFRHLHVPLGRHDAVRPVGHVRSRLQSAPVAQLVQRHSPAASHRGSLAVRPRVQRPAQSACVWHLPKRRVCRVQMPRTHFGLKLPGAMQSVSHAQ